MTLSSKDKIAEIVYHNDWIERYGHYKCYPEHEYQRIFEEMKIFNEPKGSFMLDVGCGSGAFSVRLAEVGFKVVGIDISPKMIKSAIEIAQKKKINIKYLVADIENIPFEADRFNFIFCGAILHHLPKRLHRVVREFHRILKPDGKIFMFEPYILSLNMFWLYYIGKENRLPHERALNPKKVKRVFEKNGFKDFKYKNIGSVATVPQEGFARKPVKKSFIYRTSKYIYWRCVGNHLAPDLYFVASCTKSEKKIKYS